LRLVLIAFASALLTPPLHNIRISTDAELVRVVEPLGCGQPTALT
jgi:hypothetical protein